MSHKHRVMYETMTVYKLSWSYFLSFIFFTAFAFLNMVIGIVVNVLDEERSIEKNLADNSKEVNLETLHKQLNDIQEQLNASRK